MLVMVLCFLAADAARLQQHSTRESAPAAVGPSEEPDSSSAPEAAISNVTAEGPPAEKAAAVKLTAETATAKKAPVVAEPTKQPQTLKFTWQRGVAAKPGEQLQGVKESAMPQYPKRLGFLRAVSGGCRRCLKNCLVTKIQRAQDQVMKVQAPLSLGTWYFFNNRPFRMWPLETSLAKLKLVPSAVWGGVVASAYMSCRDQCHVDCPYPGSETASFAKMPPPELENVNPRDLRFLRELYHRGSRRGGGWLRDFKNIFGELFRLV